MKSARFRSRKKWLAYSKAKQRRWRERHPVKYAFQLLKASARARDIPFLWEFEDFHAWATETGYYLLRWDGYECHRIICTLPYCRGNCVCVRAPFNRALAAVEKRIHSRERKVNPGGVKARHYLYPKMGQIRAAGA